MSANEAPYVFKYPLLNRGLHFDFLRLRCGTEPEFHKRVSELRAGNERPRTFVALSEWDALVILPTTELYPELLNQFYDNFGIDSKIAGTAGYFAYLWRHPLNGNLDDKLNRMERDGLSFVISLRFEDWVRREMGLGAEILFCDHLETMVKDPALTTIVAHTFGWNDIVIVVHTTGNEKRLLKLQSQIRLLKLEDIIPRGKAFKPSRTGVPMFAASYTHIVGGYDAFAEGKPILGNLADEVLDARLLVRVAPELEWQARGEIKKLSRGKIGPRKMPTELGHYTFSADLTALLHDRSGGGTAMIVVDGLRDFIGRKSREATGDPQAELFNSYAETTTILRFRDPSSERDLGSNPVDEDIRESVRRLRTLMDNLPEQLRGSQGSAMTAHRFGTILTTLLDHLGDPIRNSVVRHITRFLVETPNITDLDRQDMEDLCQIVEYAMSQATDGIAQFQHDANALGVTGRGGYSRLVTAIETYVDDILLGVFGISDKNFLITFGLSRGHLGSVAQFQIDVPFNILFVPTRWYILLHEAGHMAWAKKFGWMAESLAIYDALEAEIVASKRDPKKRPRRDVDVPMEFIRTRELVRELFPNMLVFFVACGGDVHKFDRLSMRHILSRSRSGRGARELLFAVALSCLMKMNGNARKRGGAWFAGALKGKFLGPLDVAIRRAIQSVSDAFDVAAEDRQQQPHVRNTIKNKQALLSSPPFVSAVTDTVNAVLRVMRLLGKTLSNDKHLGKHMLDDLQKAIDYMVQHYETGFKDWHDQGFDRWITDGRILATAPAAHIWARLLFETRENLKKRGDKTPEMRSQMAALLSLWHRAVVSAKDDTAATRVRNEILIPLDLVSEKVLV